MLRKQIELLPHQGEFLTDEHKFLLLCAGLGGGKSYAGAVFAVMESQKDNTIPGLITANTYRQLQNATLNTLFRFCDEHEIDYDYNQNRGILNLCGAKWFTYSLDNYDNLRGIEVGRCWSDELRDATREAFLVLLGRIRYGNNPKARFTTTPSGFDYLYDYFVGEKKTKDFHMITATSMDNKFLPDGYVETLRASYDEKIYAQEVLGQFVNIQSGRIYYAFDRLKHVKKIVYNRNYPIVIGMDFNVSPMTCTIAQVYSDTVHVFDEIFINDSNTNEVGQLIKQKYGTNVQIIPDATGKALKTSSRGLSDHEILRQMGFQINSSGNPFRVDRYNTVNNLLEKGRIVISDKCLNLIKDLERVGYKEGTNLPDTSDKSLGHISDSLGYLCWWAFPILPRKSEVMMIKR